MSEMLGNQYFMVRKFAEAESEYEKVLVKDPHNNNVGKKLILCYTQTGKLEKAKNLLREIVKDDISVIVNTDLVSDDCPCAELIEKIDNTSEIEIPYLLKIEILAILWLFCNIDKSKYYVEKLISYKNTNPVYPEVLKAINTLQDKLQSSSI